MGSIEKAEQGLQELFEKSRFEIMTETAAIKTGLMEVHGITKAILL